MLCTGKIQQNKTYNILILNPNYFNLHINEIINEISLNIDTGQNDLILSVILKTA